MAERTTCSLLLHSIPRTVQEEDVSAFLLVVIRKAGLTCEPISWRSIQGRFMKSKDWIAELNVSLEDQTSIAKYLRSCNPPMKLGGKTAKTKCGRSNKDPQHVCCIFPPEAATHPDTDSEAVPLLLQSRLQADEVPRGSQDHEDLLGSFDTFMNKLAVHSLAPEEKKQALAKAYELRDFLIKATSASHRGLEGSGGLSHFAVNALLKLFQNSPGLMVLLESFLTQSRLAPVRVLIILLENASSLKFKT